MSRWACVVAAIVALGGPAAQAQDRPSEADLFGGPADGSDGGAPSDAGSAVAVDRPSEADLFGGSDTSASDAGSFSSPSLLPPDRDTAQLSGPAAQSKFDTDEVKSDALKIGANLLMTGQVFARENIAFKDQSFSAPFVLDTFMDGRPNDRLRAFGVARLQFDPTRPLSTGAASTSTATATAGTPTIGLTNTGSINPNVLLDQLWLRFDIARRVYFTIGRQKVRWGTARIWFPTDFLNSQPRDALNPFDVRLGVNMVKVHVPIESLGWNFYAYGILDNIAPGAAGLTLERLAGAVRGEFVLGPAELGLSGIWQAGRRPRYAVDLSSALGPFDVYGEVALRDARDFLKYRFPTDTTVENYLLKAFNGEIEAYRPQGVTAQVSGGVSFQFNYTDNNSMVLAAEYFFNPMGYGSTLEYLIDTSMPLFRSALPGAADPGQVDPIQRVPLYQGKHSLALIVAAPGLPQLPWISLTASTIISFMDPSGLTRLDATFRVLQFLNVSVFGAVFYGQTGGELRFRLPADAIADQITPFLPADQRGPLRVGLRQADAPPILQAGVLLRLSI